MRTEGTEGVYTWLTWGEGGKRPDPEGPQRRAAAGVGCGPRYRGGGMATGRVWGAPGLYTLTPADRIQTPPTTGGWGVVTTEGFQWMRWEVGAWYL